MLSLVQLAILIGIILIIVYFIVVCKSDTNKQKKRRDSDSDSTNQDVTNIETDVTNLPTESQKYLALFIAPWCGYCQKIYPIIDQLIEKYKDSDKIKIVPINKDENGTLATLHNIKMVPTIKLCINGLENPQECVEYSGDRSFQDIVNFIEKYL